MLVRSLFIGFVLAIGLSTMGCADDGWGSDPVFGDSFPDTEEDQSPDTEEDQSPDTEGDQSETWEETKISCPRVDAAPFLKKAHGIWQVYHPNLRQPSCSSNATGNEIVRSFTTFNKFNRTLDRYQSSYGTFPQGALACRDGRIGTGNRVGSDEPQKIDFCQTPELLKQYGADYYFMKSESGFYTLVGSTEDSLGRTVLLISRLQSNQTDIKSWLEAGDTLTPYIDHDDFESVKVDW